ncbi:5930_t:CDS:2 [Gigaspora margarita]|uniref:5930_t:CDS:1 n=1 Tax=Gigaspora margarita TaxID=4874 RepID=A0ABN7VR25_GIGMA|nr:5930_t:CDS:2 [Gigaspora margarita]
MEDEFFKEPTVTTLSRKVMLELLECGTTDYGTDEVQKQITDQELKQTEKIKKFIENSYKEVIVQEAIDSLVQDKKNLMMIPFRPDSRPLKKSLNEINSKEENIYSSIWASKSEGTLSPILQNVKKATIIRTQEHRKTKAVYVQLTSRAISRIEALKKAWAIHFEEKKTAHISLGKFSSNIIQKKKKFRAIIKNLSKNTLELSMFRQFKNINAKMVHIPENSNKNQHRRAFIYFESETDLMDIRHQRLERTAYQKEFNRNRAVKNQRNSTQNRKML